MTLLTLITFLPPVIAGVLLVHLLWPVRQMPYLLLKAFLGIGLGLGSASLLYFVYLLAFAGQRTFIFIEILALLALLAGAICRESRSTAQRSSPSSLLPPSPAVWVLVAVAGIVFLVSLWTTANYLLRRRQGDWDAWMMYNRAARFVYLDQAHWLGSFSPSMDPIFHNDYPLLLGMDIASVWDTLGRDTPQVPMVQSALFAAGCAGLLTSALVAIKSSGQGALGLVILWGVPIVVNEGARQMADIPLAFYVLATGIFLNLYALRREAGLVILAGVSAGLGAWTKNEGALLVIGTLVAVLFAFVRRDSWRVLLYAVAGLAGPMAIVLYFRIFLAPPGDMLSGAGLRAVQQTLDAARHAAILGYAWKVFTDFGSWGIAPLAIGILPILTVYYLLFRAPMSGGHQLACIAGIVILAVQLIGYYAAYVLSPYDLAWHLSYSSPRLMLQVFPLLLFVLLCASRTPESVFENRIQE